MLEIYRIFKDFRDIRDFFEEFRDFFGIFNGNMLVRLFRSNYGCVNQHGFYQQIKPEYAVF